MGRALIGSFLLFLALTLAVAPSNAFLVPRALERRPTRRSVALTTPPEDVLIEPPSSSTSLSSFVLSKEESRPILRIGKDDKEKIVNAFGFWCLFVSLLTGPLWTAAMSLVQATVSEEQDPHRSLFDTTGKIWAKTWLTLTHSYPTVSGSGTPLPVGRPCLYVANHASWLDIPVLCTVLDPVFKFIAKGELRKAPCIGQQLAGGKHILIDRDDRKSQLRTFKDGLAWLERGVPIMAFPEGKRSSDGRLQTFKKGLFSLAVKAQVPIVPITLSNTHAVMPTYSFFPVQPGAGKIQVHFGKAIDPEGRTEAELEALVRQEFLAHLPSSQLPVVESTAVVPEGMPVV